MSGEEPGSTITLSLLCEYFIILLICPNGTAVMTVSLKHYEDRRSFSCRFFTVLDVGSEVGGAEMETNKSQKRRRLHRTEQSVIAA